MTDLVSIDIGSQPELAHLLGRVADVLYRQRLDVDHALHRHK